MKNYNENDWIETLEEKTKKLSIEAFILRELTVILFITKPWIMDDINLCERFTNLLEIEDENYKQIDSLLKEINDYKTNIISFSQADLIDEFDYISENVSLSISYYQMILGYLYMIKTNMSQVELSEYFSINYDNSECCFKQLKINNKELKKLKQERRND